MILLTVGANIFSGSIYYNRRQVTRPSYIHSFEREGIELAADWADREHFCLGFRIVRLACIRRMRSTKRVRIIYGDTDTNRPETCVYCKSFAYVFDMTYIDSTSTFSLYYSDWILSFRISRP